jgi:nicotinamidase-related amidase
MAQALLVIDVQVGMFAFPEKPHDGEMVVERIVELIERARTAGVAVVFVQHDGENLLAADKPGHALHPRLQPRGDEKCIVKQHSSVFHDTDLDSWLKKRMIDTLTICGMQSEHCVDSAVRSAVERGYKVTLASDAHSTFNSPVMEAQQIVALENQTLGGAFARVLRSTAISFAG